MMEKIAEKLIDELIGGLTDEVKRLISKSVKSRLLEYQVEEYNRNLFSKTLIYRETPKKLFDFYQPLFIRPTSDREGKIRIETKSVHRLFESHNFITLFGTGGSGKSTITKYLFVNCIDEEYRIPIKVELRYLNDYDGSLFDFVHNEVFLLNELAIDIKHAIQLLKSGRFLFIFDGYDEISSSRRDELTRNINDFTRKYSHNRFLLTSRPYTKIDLLPVYQNFKVCELLEEEVVEFIRKQIPSAEKEISDRIVEGYKQLDSKSYQHYLSNPLLLSMFILSFQTFSTIQTKKSNFYRDVLNSLFYLHDSLSKYGWNRQMKTGLSKDQIEEIVRIVSFVSFFEEVYLFSREYLNTVLDNLKEKYPEFVFDNDILLDDTTVGLCILIEEGTQYMFPHRSLQEYFAALYMANLTLPNKKKAYEKLLKRSIDQGFVNIFLHDNFYSLLLELDTLGVLEYLAVPLLQKFKTSLHPDTSIQLKTETLYSLYFFQHSLLAKVNNFGSSELVKDLLHWQGVRSKVLTRSRKEVNGQQTVQISPEDEKILESQDESTAKVVRSRISPTIREIQDYLESESDKEGGILDLI